MWSSNQYSPFRYHHRHLHPRLHRYDPVETYVIEVVALEAAQVGLTANCSRPSSRLCTSLDSEGNQCLPVRVSTITNNWLDSFTYLQDSKLVHFLICTCGYHSLQRPEFLIHL